MTLGIISDCVHFKTNDGDVATENHILLRQLETLSSHFTKTLICCPFIPFDQSKVYSKYTESNIEFLPLPNVGGHGLRAKTKLLFALPKWFKAFNQVNQFSDIVYQRFPNNLNIPGFFYFFQKRKKVFATYTGTWLDYKGEPSTYRFQKWLLKKYFRGPVWVYTDKAKLSDCIFGGFSPSYSLEEWNEETVNVADKIDKIQAESISIFRLITVGTLINYKNQLTILKACIILKKQNFLFHLTVVGDGPMREELQNFINDNNLSGEVEMAGKKTYAELRMLYRQNDFVVQAPLFEGFGKVPIEGFFHGCIPVINNISMAKHMTGDEERGFLFDGKDPLSLVKKLMDIKTKQELLPAIILNGREYAKSQTLEAWAANYYNTVTQYFEKA